MKQNCLRNKEFRTEIVNSALKVGISRTAVLFGVSRITVGKWMKKFQIGGEEALNNRSRKEQKHPNRITNEIIKQIIQTKTQHPEWSSLRIIRELNLEITPATVLKKIKEHFNTNKQRTDNITVYFNTTVIPAKFNYSYKYLLSAKEATSGLLVLGFANENIALMQAVFADFVFKITGWCSSCRGTITIFTGNGRYTQPGRERGAFVKLLNNKFAQITIQRKISPESIKDIATIFSSLTSSSSCEIAQKCCLATAQLNLHATTNLLNLSFLPPLEIDSALKKFHQNQLTLENQTETAIIKNMIVLLNRVLAADFNITDQLFYRLLFCLVYYNSYDSGIAKAFIQFCYKLLNKDTDLCRKSLDLFKKWQDRQNREYSEYFKIKADLDKIEGNNAAALTGYEQALHLSEKECNYQSVAEICGKLGLLYKKFGDNPTALSYFDRQQELAKSYDLEDQKYFAFLNMGYYYFSTGDLEQARFNYQKAHNISLRLNDEALQADTLSRLGDVYLYRNDLIEAEKCFLPLIELGKNNKDLTLLGESYNKLATLCVRKHEYEKALYNAEQYFNISQKRNNPAGMAISQRIMGICYLSVEQYRKALNCFKRDLQISRKLKHHEFIAVAIGNLGILYLYTNHLDKALFTFQTQLAIAQILKNLRLEYTAVTNSGITSLRLNDFQTALHFFNEQMILSKKSGEKFYLALAYQGRAQAYSSLKEFKKALTSISKAKKYFIQINDSSHLCEAEIDSAVIKSALSGKKISSKKLIKLTDDAKKNNRADLLKRIENL